MYVLARGNVVELRMRQMRSQAGMWIEVCLALQCEEAVQRIIKLTKARNKNLTDIQVGFIALNKSGEVGSYCIQGGFNYAVHDDTGNKLIDAPYYLK